MRLIVLGAMQFIFWSAYYTLSTAVLKDERFILIAFIVTLAISMVTASVFLVRPK